MTKEPMDQQKSTAYAMSLSTEVNMTNCYKHCKHFFERFKSIHFNVLIAYWMMAGYLGPVDSIEEAYKRGHEILLDLTYQEGRMLKSSNEDSEMVEFVTSTNGEPIPCSRHQGLCTTENLGFVDLLDLDQLRNGVVFTDGMLKTIPKSTEEQQHMISDSITTTNQLNGSVLLIDGNHLSRQVFHPPRKLKFLAYFEPRPDSLNPLLRKVTRHLSVLLLRDCEKLREIDLLIEKFKTLTVLELSGLSHVNDVPSILLKQISELAQLQCLNLSGLLIENLPDDFFSKLEELQWVILRGCSKLLSLPTIKPLKKLKMLDLSHCSALLKIATAALQNSQLQMLDLSYTAMSSIPTLKGTPDLTHLFLRDAKVSVLNSLKLLRKLKVLDLSGAGKVIEIHQFKDNKNIIVLNLSRTGIKSIKFLSDLTDLRNLILQGCTYLEELPAIKNLTNLEVLDLSGCEKLPHLPEDLSTLKNLKELNLSGCSSLELREGLFDHMSCLLNLDLSGSKSKCLPSFANLASLRKLTLRGLLLPSLEILASLSTLKELDLSGVSVGSLPEFKLDFLESLENLEVLNLSQTPVAQLPDLSKLKNLRKLILANCQQLEVVPGLQTLTNLETLDLSLTDCSTANNCQPETEIEGQRAIQLSVPRSCRLLVLKNRSGVQKLFPLTSHGELEYLDFRGTDVEKIPYESMAQVKCFQLPAKIDLSGVRLSRRGDLQEAIDWKGNLHGHLQGKILDGTEIQIASAIGNKSSMSAGVKQFFHLKERDNQGSWEAFIHQFSVSLPPKESNDKVIYLDGDEFILRDDLSWARRLLNLELEGSSVEIHGFSEVPEKIRNALEQADNVALVRSSFLQKQADNVASVSNKVLGSSFNICSKAMKVCCIRRCLEMESVLGKDGIIAECLDRLILSNLVNLKLICAENVSLNSIENVSLNSIESLKHIHIDCCPKLEKVIIASQVPNNLETLHIKFCDKLQTLFEKKVSLSNLKKLNLFELPKLEGIEAVLPSLETLSISRCPKLMTMFKNTGSSSSSLPKLQTLRLWNLPKLESIGVDFSLVLTLDLDPALPPSINQQLRSPGQ